MKSDCAAPSSSSSLIVVLLKKIHEVCFWFLKLLFKMYVYVVAVFIIECRYDIVVAAAITFGLAIDFIFLLAVIFPIISVLKMTKKNAISIFCVVILVFSSQTLLLFVVAVHNEWVAQVRIPVRSCCFEKQLFWTMGFL